MNRKCIAIISLLIVLAISFSEPVAYAVTPSDEFHSAVSSLNYYLTVFDDTDRRDDVSLDEISTALRNLGSYSFASGFYQYTYILLCLDRGDYRSANIFKEAIVKNKSFNDYILSWEFALEYPAIRSVDELATYVEARTEENAGNLDKAAELYLYSSLFYDSLQRMYKLQGGSSAEMYTRALALLQSKNYADAYELFKQLAEYDYQDSVLYMEICQSQIHTHNWKDATCTEPRICLGCGETEGTPIGHTFTEATCTGPQTCIRCGVTVGEALGHAWQPATKLKPETCSRCGAVRGKKLASHYVGETVVFGSYEQNGQYGEDPIEWIIVDMLEDGSMVLLSKYALNAKPYNDVWTAVTWENCSLREWLNEGFYNAAFSSEEKDYIIKSNIYASGNPYYNTYVGNDTEDYVFLLSIAQVRQYLTNSQSRKCEATRYAQKQSKIQTDGNKLSSDDACSWWLRTPGEKADFAAYVDADGEIRNIGAHVYRDDYAVRPALFVRSWP